MAGFRVTDANPAGCTLAHLVHLRTSVKLTGLCLQNRPVGHSQPVFGVKAVWDERPLWFARQPGTDAL